MKWVREYDTAEVSYSELKMVLRRAPKQIFGLGEQSGVELMLPTPRGMQRFRVWENDVLSADVQATIPDQRLYSGQGIDDPSATLRCELGYGSFRAMVLSPGGTSFVEPMRRRNNGTYFFYGRENSMRQPSWSCKVLGKEAENPLHIPDFQSGGTGFAEARNTGTNLWTFRLALNATAEYNTFWSGNTTTSTSAMTTSVNRVDGVYIAEMAIHLNLVRAKVFTNAAVFTNDDGGAMLTQNQSQCDLDPGSSGYDIGHVFSTGGGGIAQLSCVGVAGSKAKGVTGSPSPTGDPFDIDYVAHEMGHQFGANHSFNGITDNCASPNRSRTSAREPGSGSTIMAYAGICGTENVQLNSDPYMHVNSIVQILPQRVTSRGGVSTSTTNQVPTVDAGLDYTIPISTPFKLTMVGSDPNSDPLTYQWDQNDTPATGDQNAGPTTTSSTNTSRPLFRSYNPTTNPTRYFPNQNLILANNFTNAFDFLPNVGRTLNFRAVVRDNRATGGGTVWDTNVITVATGSSAFAVSSPNTNITWNRNRLFNVTWNNAATNSSPFNVSQVRIYLSQNSGLSYFSNPPTATLLGTTANDGSEMIAMPLSTPGGASNRIFVEAVGNVFFDVSNTNFTIATTNTAPSLAVVSDVTIPELSPWSTTLSGADADDAQAISYSLVSGPSGLTVNPTSGLVSWTPSEAQGPGSYPVTVRVSDNNVPTPGTADRTFTINVTEVGSVVTGTVNLLSYIPTEVGMNITVQIGTNAGNTILETGAATIGAGNQFEYTTSVSNGTYSVYVSRLYFLRKRVSNVNIVTGSVNAGTFNLIGGDFNSSGEIDPVDLDIVIANFGGGGPIGDTDGSGEVDPIDIDLVISNFGAQSD